MFFALNAIILRLLFLEVNKMNVLSLYTNIFQSISCNYIYGDCARASLSKSPKPKRARAWVTIFVTRARARLLRCYACSSAVSTAPMSSLKQTERAAISRGANASPKLMHAYVAFLFLSAIRQNGYLMMPGVLPPTPSSSRRMRPLPYASTNA